jgi:hypothetical protein
MRKANSITAIALTVIVLSFLIGLGWSFFQHQDAVGWLLAADSWIGPVVLILIFFKVVRFVADLR